MYPQTTYELSIRPQNKEAKDRIIDFLHGAGFDSFVEGAVDDLDIDHEFGLEQPNLYEKVGGETSPLSVYKFTAEELVHLKAILSEVKDHSSEILSHKTTAWLDGWKESFKPIMTERFYIFPPWDRPTESVREFEMMIEPGMAFGTGQHATTMLCLREIESICQQEKIASAADVGTGTGILAIAMAKLGVSSIVGTDIDSDAIVAAGRNLSDNNVSFELLQTSVPRGEFDLVVANILTVVLLKLMPELANVTKMYLVLSGILVEQAEDVVTRAESCGMKLASQSEQDGWVSLRFVRE